MSNARELAELGGSYGTGGFVGMKNRIINGAMMIDQRNAGASVTPTNGQYLVDRFAAGVTQASKLTAQQSTTAPVGFINSLVVTSSSAYSITSTDQFFLYQPVEGLNCADLAWGTASAATVTLSFWVRSSLTGTFGGAVSNNANDRSYPFAYTINAANTWEQKSVTISGDTTGTWLTNTSAGLKVFWSLGIGSTNSGTAGSWAGANYKSATGATSVVGTSGATFYITGVQLEKGSTATSFDYRPYGTELALCQRYTYVWDASEAGSNYGKIGLGFFASGTIFKGFTYFPVKMRAAPTSLTTSGSINMYDGALNIDATSIAIDQATPLTIDYEIGCSGATAYRPALLQAKANNTAKVIVSAEL